MSVLKTGLITGGSLAAVIGGFTALQRLGFHRSFMAGVGEIVVAFMAKDSSEEEETKKLEERKKSGKEETVDVSSFKTKSSLSTDIVDGRKVWTMNKDSKSNSTILYLHGGGYVAELGSFQWVMADKLAQMTDSEIIIPDYGLAPFYTYKEAYELSTKLYMECREKYPQKKVYLMGDSAGGGLALGLAQYFAGQKIQMADGLILLSPWIDVTMVNPQIPDYIKKDPMLKVRPLIADGKAWAGDKDPADWMISPLFKDMKGLPPVLLFSGTREIFFPDEETLYKKLKTAGIPVTFEIGRNLNHVYPAFPIPEARAAIEKMADFVR